MERQHYTGEYCPLCLNGRDPVEIDFTREKIGMLQHGPNNIFMCSLHPLCLFTAPLVAKTGQELF
jgi:hypothetical protein